MDRADAASVFEDMITRLGVEALVMFEGMAAKFAGGSGPEERERLASVFYAKGRALEKLSRKNEARLTLDDLIARFENDENPAVRDVVSHARADRDRILSGDGGLA